jgi:steroid delta-isomerase-like uncharacterized protein
MGGGIYAAPVDVALTRRHPLAAACALTMQFLAGRSPQCPIHLRVVVILRAEGAAVYRGASWVGGNRALGQGDHDMTQTTEESNKALVEQLMAAWNTHDADAVAAHYTADVLNHTAQPGSPPGREGLKLTVQAFLAAFPDLHVEAHHVLADGDMVAFLTRISGTHTSALADVPASGNSVTLEGAVVLRIEDGKIAELWNKIDNLALMQQIGAIPTPTG